MNVNTLRFIFELSSSYKFGYNMSLLVQGRKSPYQVLYETTMDDMVKRTIR